MCWSRFLTSACSLAARLTASAIASVPVFVLLHLAVLIVPAAFWGSAPPQRRADGSGRAAARHVRGGPGRRARLRHDGTGAVAPGSLAAALRIGTTISPAWSRAAASPASTTKLRSDRLLADPAAQVPRFRSILHGTSIEATARVLGVIGRRYHRFPPGAAQGAAQQGRLHPRAGRSRRQPPRHRGEESAVVERIARPGLVPSGPSQRHT